jgi:hypothetical protein
MAGSATGGRACEQTFKVESMKSRQHHRAALPLSWLEAV